MYDKMKRLTRLLIYVNQFSTLYLDDVVIEYHWNLFENNGRASKRSQSDIFSCNVSRTWSRETQKRVGAHFYVPYKMLNLVGPHKTWELFPSIKLLRSQVFGFLEYRMSSTQERGKRLAEYVIQAVLREAVWLYA